MLVHISVGTKQTYWQFADDIFKGIFLNYFFVKISLIEAYLKRGSIGNKSPLVRVRVSNRADKPLHEHVMTQFSDPFITLIPAWISN